jgi:TP901 family phage tail tape measure protein
MAGSLILQIGIDDKGNPAIMKLGTNAKKAKGDVAPLGDVLQKVFASAVMLKGLEVINTQLMAAVKGAQEFELAIKKVSAIGGATGDALSAVRDTAKQLSVETEHSAVALSNSMLELTKMGYESDDVNKMIKHTANLATAAQEDLAWSTVNTANLMKAFGLGAADTEKTVNTVANALNLTSLNLEEYMDAMKYVSPIAKTLNVSFEETTALLGLLSDRGIKGSLAGTSIKNMMLKLIAPTGNVAKALQDVNFEGMNLTEVMGVLHDKGVNTSSMLKQFDLRALTGALAVGENAKEVAKLTAILEGQGKTAKEVADIIRESFIMQLAELKNTVMLVGIELNEALGSNGVSLLQNLKGHLMEAVTWIKANKEELSEAAEKISQIANALMNVLLNSLKVNKTEILALGSALAAITAVKTYTSIVKVGKAFTDWKLKTLTTDVKGLEMAMLAAVGVGLTLRSIIIEMANKKLVQADANAFGAANYRTQEHLDALMKMAPLYEDIRKKEQALVDVGVKAEDAHKGLFDEYKKLNDALTSYEQKWGRAGRDMVDTYKEWADTVKTLNKLLPKELTKPEGPSAKPKEGPGFGNKIDMNEFLYDQKLLEIERQKESIDRTKAALKANKSEISKYEGIAIKGRKGEKEAEKALKEIATFNAKSREMELKSISEIGDAGVDIYANIQERMFSKYEERINKELELLQASSDAELTLAGDNAFRKQMILDKTASKELAIKKKLEAERKAFEKRQAIIDIARATADAVRGVVSVMADTRGGLVSRLASGLAYGAIAASYVAQLSAVNFRYGSKEPIRGNGTSDTIPTLMSPGERALSVNEIDRLGGNQNLQKMIDRGDSYTTNSSVNVYIKQVVGQKQYVRDTIIPIIKKEMAR